MTIANKNTEKIIVGNFILEVPKPVKFLGCDDVQKLSLESKLQFATRGESFREDHYKDVTKCRHTNR